MCYNRIKIKMGEKFDLNTGITRETAVTLLLKYNKEKFHIQHAVTVESVMKGFAKRLGFTEDAEEWGIAGLLHDIDFERYPDEHCIKAPELLHEVNASSELIHAVCSHGYGITVDIKPEHEMEKVLFACDELKSLKKKFKDKKFAAGCSRDIIARGAEMLGWELDKLLGDTLDVMREVEKDIANNYKELTGEEL